MQAPSGTPDALIISQDDDTEIRVQPVTQGGTRHLDIRIWKRGPSGFTPTRDALMLDQADLEALRQGIVELLEASEGGSQVARIVLDTGDGRRLRAETEPFGTRYVAHFGFWQRGRDSWRPDGDGIVLLADRLPRLESTLARYAAWLTATPTAVPAGVPEEIHRPLHEPWPVAGADWLTVEPTRVTLHPRGIRITLSVEGESDHHCLALRQWRREESLWIPEPAGLTLTAIDLDELLRALRGLVTRSPSEHIREEVRGSNGSLRVEIGNDSGLRIEQHGADGAGGTLALPAEYLPRLGRALAQSWSMLVGMLSPGERDELRERETEERLPSSQDNPAPGSIAGETKPINPAPRAVGPAVRFGENSEYPGAIIPQEGQVRIVVEGYLLPRGLTLPADVVARVVTGLEELFALQLSQPRIAPMLMCDRPDCAVYGRVGTTTRPEAVEIRAWSSPRSSESVTFDRAYLPQVIEGLRAALRALSQPEPLPSMSFLTTQRVMEQLAPPAPPPVEVEAAEPEVEAPPPSEPEPEPPPTEHLSEAWIDTQLIRFDLEDERILLFNWDGETLRLRVDELDDLLSKVRALYYDALRGRRGRPLIAGTGPAIEVGIHNQGAAMHLQLRDANDEEGSILSFHAVQTSTFLNAARSAVEDRERSAEA